jgi:hypothetical protein
MEKFLGIDSRSSSQFRRVGGALAMTTVLAGCNTQHQAVLIRPATSSVVSRPTPATYPETPDMVGFLKTGSSTTCLAGGSRPCAILIRTSPNRASAIVNASPTQPVVQWPREPYGSKAGDTVNIRCYTPAGQLIKPYEGNSESTDWYEVVVPPEYVLNPAVQQAVIEHSPSVRTEELNGTTAVLGWATVEWFNQSTASSSIPIC